jgi:wobble nucleotide-excising tRNase
MIESISIADTASFGSSVQTLNRLSTFNFIFGANGTGKTTISRVIADESAFPTCRVGWKSGTKMQPVVYNRDFVEKNFDQSADLKGVFTLGEQNIDVLKNIALTKDELDQLTKKIEALNLALDGEDGTGGKNGELRQHENQLQARCWAAYTKHKTSLWRAFEGFRHSKEAFKNQILKEWATNTDALNTLADLEKRAETVFGPSPELQVSVPEIDGDALLAHDTNPILSKRVIGKDDVDIAAMIKKLGNSDWVRAGRLFYDANGRICPFCQQGTKEAFAQSLNEYFDDTFELDSKAIDDLIANYKSDSTRLQQQTALAITTPCKFLDVDALKAQKDLLDSRVATNLQELATKKKEPSQIVQLQSIADVVLAIRGHIQAANALVCEHNRVVANLATERRALTSQVWKYLLETELKGDLEQYKSKRDSLDKAIKAMDQQIQLAALEKSEKTAILRSLEKQTTSIQPTIDGINNVLSSFGFQGFSVAKADQGTSYRLVRSGGADARATLSEGERNFLTFLYFYHLLKGSTSDSGMTTDRVVVFDDPVSSLDSDILFVVANLIKGLFDEVRAGDGHIKQVFVLSHNVYFHKEVTFNPRRVDKAMNEETFWIVRKLGAESKVEQHPTNPIRTSYELLWAEVKRSDHSNVALQNTLRRILETYFKILGGVDSDKLCGMFQGKEKLICRSLFSWINDGSHYANDDLYVSSDGTTVDSYLRVFAAVFDKSGHEAHYRMMMGDTRLESPVKGTAA